MMSGMVVRRCAVSVGVPRGPRVGARESYGRSGQMGAVGVRQAATALPACHCIRLGKTSRPPNLFAAVQTPRLARL